MNEKTELQKAVENRLGSLEDDAYRYKLAGNREMHDRRMLQFYKLKDELKNLDPKTK